MHRRKIRLEGLPVKAYAPEKIKLAAAMKASTSVSNGWLAERLRMGAAATVSQYVRRFRLAGGIAQRDFQHVLSKVKS